MRILFSFAGGLGHFYPLVPLAREAQAAGHTVAFACRDALISRVEAEGFEAFVTTSRGTREDPARIPLRRPDQAREDREFREGFARSVAAGVAPRLADLCAIWRPDVLVGDETAFSLMVVAERLDLPYATVLVLAAGSFVRPDLVAEPLAELRAAHGLAPDPGLEMLSRHLVLSPFPPSFRDPAHPLLPTAHSVRLRLPEVAAPPVRWPGQIDGAPLVYVTLGTVFNVESGDLFPRVVAGLGGMAVNVLVTVGEGIDPGELGPQPGNVCVKRFVAQERVLPHAGLAVTQGGSGSINGAFFHGVPLVLIPLGADQLHNGARCEALGVARVLDAVDATPGDVAAAVEAVLADPSYRRASERLGAELAALPGADHALALLEQLAAGWRP